MNRVILYLIIILILSSISCSKQKYCAAFKEVDLKNIPYEISDTLKFRNQNGDFFEIFIDKFEKSEANSFNCRDLHDICPCIKYVKVISKDNKNSNPYVFLKMEQSDASNMQYFKYQILDYYFEFDFRNELSKIKDFDNIELVNTVVISNNAYSEVLVIKDLNNPGSSISQVYFNKTDGILKFVEKTGSEWNLVK